MCFYVCCVFLGVCTNLASECPGYHDKIERKRKQNREQKQKSMHNQNRRQKQNQKQNATRTQKTVPTKKKELQTEEKHNVAPPPYKVAIREYFTPPSLSSTTLPRSKKRPPLYTETNAIIKSRPSEKFAQLELLLADFHIRPHVLSVLQLENIDLEIFPFMTDEHLRNLGLKMGPRVKLRAAIEFCIKNNI